MKTITATIYLGDILNTNEKSFPEQASETVARLNASDWVKSLSCDDEVKYVIGQMSRETNPDTFDDYLFELVEFAADLGVNIDLHSNDLTEGR